MLTKTNGGFLISKVKQVQGRVFEKMLAKHGISDFNGAQGRILYVLWEEDNIPIRQLSARTGLAKTTLTSMLDRLENLGHIKRKYSSSDRRIVRITLTEKAKNLKSNYEKVSSEMNEIFYNGFTDGEITAFENYLERILTNLTEQEN